MSACDVPHGNESRRRERGQGSIGQFVATALPDSPMKTRDGHPPSDVSQLTMLGACDGELMIGKRPNPSSVMRTEDQSPVDCLCDHSKAILENVVG